MEFTKKGNDDEEEEEKPENASDVSGSEVKDSGEEGVIGAEGGEGGGEGESEAGAKGQNMKEYLSEYMNDFAMSIWNRMKTAFGQSGENEIDRWAG